MQSPGQGPARLKPHLMASPNNENAAPATHERARYSAPDDATKWQLRHGTSPSAMGLSPASSCSLSSLIERVWSHFMRLWRRDAVMQDLVLCVFQIFDSVFALARKPRFRESVAVVIALCTLWNTAACGRNLPNPVTVKDGLARIPIGDMVFVIPEKTWLKGYSRNSTDGLVSGFQLHAVAPEVEPWSPENNARMYKVPGWGAQIQVTVDLPPEGKPLLKQTQKRLEDVVKGCFFTKSNAYPHRNVRYCQNGYDKIFGYLEGDHFKYLLYCDSDEVKKREKFPTDPECRLHFRHREALLVTATFAERYSKFAFDMAHGLEAKLIEFDKTAAVSQKQNHQGTQK